WHAQRFVQAASESHRTCTDGPKGEAASPGWKPFPSQEFIKSAALAVVLAWRSPNTVKPFERLGPASPASDERLHRPCSDQADDSSDDSSVRPTARPPDASCFSSLRSHRASRLRFSIGYLLCSPSSSGGARSSRTCCSDRSPSSRTLGYSPATCRPP